MVMRLKNGYVKIYGIKPELVLGIIILQSFFNEELIITSGSEHTTKHMPSSLHYSGNAVDIREPAETSAYTKTEIKNALGSEFDLIFEKDHWHLEFQPKII
jgi:hypothetical protein